jgi:hypothetical protein
MTPGRTTIATTKEVLAAGPHKYAEPFQPPLVPERKQKLNSRSVSCVDCRPSVVPLEKSTDRQSRRHSTSDASDEWRLVATELSKKLLATARKRDEAVVEAAHLRQMISGAFSITEGKFFSNKKTQQHITKDIVDNYEFDHTSSSSRLLLLLLLLLLSSLLLVLLFCYSYDYYYTIAAL